MEERKKPAKQQWPDADGKWPSDYALREYPTNDWTGEPPTKFWHTCECCGRKEFLSAQEAYEEGWDYPPAMGHFGVVSQRNCPKCLLKDSLYWRMHVEHTTTLETMERDDLFTLGRILMEPESLRDENRNHYYLAHYVAEYDTLVVVDFHCHYEYNPLKFTCSGIKKFTNVKEVLEGAEER